ncbi:MAG: T9SS type A sorting domain-containing protein [Bacteroidetes bacterium]|nr:T9SS type A sorting domain-containing protein [Bacteroidota bacterium]
MRYHRITGLFLLLALLLGFALEAQAQVGNCTPALGEAFLDINNVRARILNNGGLFWRGDPFVYEVPKGGGANAIFTSGIWIGGFVGGNLRAAAARYRNYQFWGGPLDDAGNPPADCAEFDRLYKISRSDIEDYEATGVTTPDLRDWPTGLGAPTLAPRDNGVDDDGDGEVDEPGEEIVVLDQPLSQRINRVIDLAGGERPAILGDQSIWWVMNDRGNEHQVSGADTPPIGLEVHVTAFAFNTSGDIGNSTFYRYNFFYKGNEPFTDVYIGIFSDPDLGNFDDDWVGSDTTLGMGFVYNSDNEDEGGDGYGSPVPAAGYDFFQGPLVPSVATDSGIVNGEYVFGFRNLKMTHFIYYNNGNAVNEDPQNGTDYYNYLSGKWKDGQQITFGGNGRDFSEIPTDFMYPGDPVTCAFWSECNSDDQGTSVAPADRRFAMSSGPFTINPGDFQQIVFGIVWALGEDNFDSVRALREADALAQAAFDVNFQLPPPPAAPSLTATALDGQIILEWDNSTRSNNYLESYVQEDPFAPEDDPDYVFEGYDVIQFDNNLDQVGKLIATYDVINGITRVIDGIPGEPTSVTAKGSDSGVQRYHVVGGLTNYTTYYFGVQAFAFNEPSSPKIYRGPLSRVSVTPTRTIDVLSDAAVEATATGTRTPDIIGDKVGKGGGTVTADVVNPALVTGETYRVEFLAADDGSGKRAVSPFGEEGDSDLPDVVPFRQRASKGADVAATVTTYDIFRGSEKIFDGVTDAIEITGEAAPQGTNVMRFDGLSFSIAGPPASALEFDGGFNEGGDDPVVIEVQGPGGADPCGPDASSTFGCDQVGGNNVWISFNGTAEYIWGSPSTASYARLSIYAPNDFEIRVTTEGSIGYHPFTTGNMLWTPVEAWDIGPTGPFNSNDTSDDVQLIINIFSDGGGECFFGYGEGELFGRPFTDRMYAYYPTTSYADYEALAKPLVDADPNGCPTDPATAEASDIIDFGRGRPLQREVMIDNTGGAKDVADLVGVIVRFHTTKPNLPGDVFTISTEGLGAQAPDAATQRARLDEIGIVPNPYKGASAYEVSQLTDQVRFTNLPDVATIRIFTLNGSLIQTLEKQSPGVATLSWNLTTDNNLPIASGVYLIHIEVPGVGEKVLKFAVVKKRIQLNVF